MSATMDRVLEDFLADSGLVDAGGSVEETPITSAKSRRTAKGVLTQGVWVGCRGSDPRRVIEATSDGKACDDSHCTGDDDQDEEDEDELLWWSWNDKLVGFNDW